MAKILSKEEVSAHKKPDDLWVIIDEDVYNLTDFQTEHPGKYITSQRPTDDTMS
jgi:cytochrome b involved in lipid metabolism